MDFSGIEGKMRISKNGLVIKSLLHFGANLREDGQSTVERFVTHPDQLELGLRRCKIGGTITLVGPEGLPSQPLAQRNSTFAPFDQSATAR